MRSLFRSSLPIVFFLTLSPLFLKAQERPATDTTTLWRIETNDENEYFGNILERTTEEIRLKTDNLGVVTLQVRNIREIERVSTARFVEGAYWFENPQATRYFWGPNGYGLRPGEGYYQNVWIFFNQFSIGITNNTSIGIGTVPLFLLGGAAETPVWLSPKVSIPVDADRINVGAGALIGTALGAESGAFGIAYGALTVGTRDKNFNVGLGYGFGGGEFATTPTVTVSGMIRTGRRGYFLTENYWIDAGGSTLLLLSAGGRHVGRSISFDYGGFLPLAGDLDTFIVIPWLGISVPIGKAGRVPR